VPRSTSRIEHPRRRRTQPQPPAEAEGGDRETEESRQDSSRGVEESSNRDDILPPPTSDLRRPTRASATRRPPSTPRRPPPRLAETAGPDPQAPPSRVRLTVGTILGPHGVNGEFKLRLQTDDPEHLLTVKRLFLGDEPAPRTVLGARRHAGHMLMRLQGISSPETVERFRGTPLRMRGADARPLAPNEYFLYQIVGLAVFDEDGTRLGTVTDLLETGANEVLVVTPDNGGADLLLPSVPDVVLTMDPAAGRIVVRPPRYYGE
jgi:16S rRNA processing protein RimM